MEIYHLPDCLTDNLSTDVLIHHYKTSKLHVRHKVVLNQNLIGILVKGTKHIFGAHESVSIGQHDIFLLTKGSVIMMESAAHDDILESYLIYFSNDVLRALCLKHQLSHAIAREASHLTKIEKDNFIINFERSLALLNPQHLQSMRHLKLEELLLYLYYNHESSFRAFLNSTLSPWSVEEKLREVVRKNADSHLSLDELAFLCDMSLSTFKRYFVRVFKTSPKKYFTAAKMIKARALLQLDRRPSEIFVDLNYQSLSSFSAEFKKHYGVSPRSFQYNSKKSGEE